MSFSDETLEKEKLSYMRFWLISDGFVDRRKKTNKQTNKNSLYNITNELFMAV